MSHKKMIALSVISSKKSPTTSLNPAFSPGSRRIVRRPLENSCAGLCRDKNAASVSEGRLAFAKLILFTRCRGRGWRRGRCAAVAAAGVHDEAGAFPCFLKTVRRVASGELQNKVVHVCHQLHEGGNVGFHFAQQCALVDDLSARRVHHVGKCGDGCGERGNAGGGHAASGGGGVSDGGSREIENGRGLVQ